jgi:hypothetical protein
MTTNTPINENRDLSIKIDDPPRLSDPLESRHPVTLYGDLTRDGSYSGRSSRSFPMTTVACTAGSR